MGLRNRWKSIPAKTAAELDAMTAAGAVVGQALVAVRAAAKDGVSLLELDAIAEATIRDAGAVPTFKGYEGFPGSICASVNDVVVHGIPTADHILRAGDYISIDCGATLDGWVGDSAWSFGIGMDGALDTDALDDNPDSEAGGSLWALDRATQDVLAAGIAAMVPGARLTDVSNALELATRAAEEKYGVALGIVDGYGGHGVGRSMHEDPFLPNEGRPGRGPRIQAGSVLAIEPMLTLGTVDTEVLDDDWTVVTTDGSWSSHWEHTVAATDDGPRILTPRPL
ncbi:type I methionyl aminopeptidase [Corynebacterium ulceribovis]|uniref:type I methionyl aminopeptidase n=1 Tax=Corynebacterium ulceribovis TaxID=487732 RepID=UPI000367787E|nr:type I methionyl aminopeptidase [Corynebacterium ulceribovis]